MADLLVATYLNLIERQGRSLLEANVFFDSRSGAVNKIRTNPAVSART